jgi:hypothetical protein
MESIETLGVQTIIVVVASFVITLSILVSFAWFGWKKEIRRGDTCPYTKEPMRLGMDIANSLTVYVNAFLQEQQKMDNPPIDFSKAAYCPKTGRIFTDCVSGGDQIYLGWDFLHKRCKGTFVSWGSLSEEEQGVLKLLHESVDEFQTEKSSKRLRLEEVEEEFAELAPGPLYVDRRERTLMGWKKVPGTYFEVLVVQRPKFQSVEETL